MRIVTLVVVLPVRMVWDVLAACGRACRRATAGTGRLLCTYVLAPVGHAIRFLAVVLLVRPWAGFRRYLLTPLGHGAAWLVRYGLVVPVVWAYRWVLTPLGHGTATLVRWLAVPLVWVYRRLLTPLGHGLVLTVRGVGRVIATLGRWLFVLPVVVLWRYVLAPVGRALLVVAREIAEAIAMAWRVAGHVSRAVGRVLKWFGWHLVGWPVHLLWRTVLAPVAHWTRDTLWRPVRKAAAEAGRGARAALRSARRTVRQTRRDAWRALVGGTGPREAREPVVPATRTLGCTTTVPDEAPDPEISLLGKKTAEQG